MEEEEQKDSEQFWSFVHKYFPELKRSSDDVLPNASHVYIGSLSVHKDSFPLWEVYSDNEKGVNLEFNSSFFDIRGKAYDPHILRDYVSGYYRSADYPLYNVNYIGDKFVEELEKYRNSGVKHDGGERTIIIQCDPHIQK